MIAQGFIYRGVRVEPFDSNSSRPRLRRGEMYRFQKNGAYVIHLPDGSTQVVEGEQAARRAKEYIDRYMGWES